MLVGTTITRCSIGNDEILIDTDSEKDLIITIDTNTAFWRIRNNDSIIASSFPLISEQHSECDEFEALEGISSLDASLEDTNQLMNGLILGMKINEVKACDIDLMLKLENTHTLKIAGGGQSLSESDVSGNDEHKENNDEAQSPEEVQSGQKMAM